MNEDPAALWEANAELWTRHVRAGYDVYRDVYNTPAFLAMLPPVAGLRGLDIGCGEGANTRSLARLGARMDAIDVAPTFVAYAQAAEVSEPLGITYRLGNALELPFAGETFDFTAAFMSFQDVADYRVALREAFRVTRPGGFFQFSISHPCFVPPQKRVLRDDAGVAYAIEIGRYFDTAHGHVERWRFGAAPDDVKAATEPFTITHYHHTLSDWFGAIMATGFAIEEIGEPMADEATALAYPTVADTRVTPQFLHIRARRPSP